MTRVEVLVEHTNKSTIARFPWSRDAEKLLYGILDCFLEDKDWGGGAIGLAVKYKAENKRLWSLLNMAMAQLDEKCECVS